MFICLSFEGANQHMQHGVARAQREHWLGAVAGGARAQSLGLPERLDVQGGSGNPRKGKLPGRSLPYALPSGPQLSPQLLMHRGDFSEPSREKQLGKLSKLHRNFSSYYQRRHRISGVCLPN